MKYEIKASVYKPTGREYTFTLDGDLWGNHRGHLVIAALDELDNQEPGAGRFLNYVLIREIA